jgi:ABC-type multidrug transport system fused ATPase/permease subunit
VTSSIPIWLRWIRYLAYPNLSYSILASNEFTDRVFACPYVGPDGNVDLLKCAPYDGNLVLLYQLDIKTGLFPGPIFRLVYYFVGFLFVAWFALTVHVVNPTSMRSGPTILEVCIKQAVKIFTHKKHIPADQAGRSARSDSSANLDKTRLEETRLDVFSRGLDRKNPVTIRVEAMSLSVFVPTSEWSFRGFLSSLKKEMREKKVLKEIDVIFPAGELTAILGGSGAGKVNPPSSIKASCLAALSINQWMLKTNTHYQFAT